MVAISETISAQPEKNRTRVLIAASDAELIDQDTLDFELFQWRSSLDRDEQDQFDIRTVATLSREEFVATLSGFRPDVVVFSGRGTPERNIRMVSTDGWVRQVTGNTLGGLFAKADLKISLMLLLQCGIYRQQERVSFFSNYLVSVKSQSKALQLPLTLGAQILNLLGGRYQSLDAYRELEVGISNLDTLAGFEIDIYGPESEDSARKAGLDSFRAWSMFETKSLQETVGRGPGLHPKPSGDQASGEKKPGARMYRVWFGTNRDVKTHGRKVGFGSDRTDTLTHGYCDVAIPKYHKIGSLGDPSWKRFPAFWRNNRLRVRLIRQLKEEAYFAKLRELFLELSNDERVLLIFLHGYNVSFENAALRAAQFGVDLQIPGTTAFFSWPSKGKLLDYLADEATIEASEKHISAFVQNMCEKSGAEVVHVIAHSMGNRGLLKSFCAMTERIRKRVGVRLNQVILAAPDVDAGVFRDLASIYSELSTRTTMYVSSKDSAVALSARLHSYHRAGFTPPVTVVEGIDTIQAANVDVSALGHGYFAEARPVLSDMHVLLTSDTPPESRFGLKAATNEDSDNYWIIQP